MSELQAILARRRLLNKEKSAGDNEGHASVQQQQQPPLTTKNAPQRRVQNAATISSSTQQTSHDLQSKLRERRLKATQTYSKHLRNDLGHANAVASRPEEAKKNALPSPSATKAANNASYTRQTSVPPRSTFFPRSTPNLPKSSGSNINTFPKSPQVSSTAVPSPKGGAHSGRDVPQKTTEPKSPSMLDYMAKKYKEEKRLRSPPQQHPEPKPEPEVKEEKPSTYYRTGMRPLPSSASPSRGNWKPSSSPSTGTLDRNIVNESNKEELEGAPSEASVVDGSVFSEGSGGVPEFMRMRLKKTKKPEQEPVEEAKREVAKKEEVATPPVVRRWRPPPESNEISRGFTPDNLTTTADKEEPRDTTQKEAEQVEVPETLPPSFVKRWLPPSQTHDNQNNLATTAAAAATTTTKEEPQVMKRWRPKPPEYDASKSSTPERNGLTSPNKNSSPEKTSWIQQRQHLQQRNLNADVEKSQSAVSMESNTVEDEVQEEEVGLNYASLVSWANKLQNNQPRGGVVLPPPLSKDKSNTGLVAPSFESENGQVLQQDVSEPALISDNERVIRLQEDAEEDEPPTQTNKSPMFANYSTAVMAAKEAIDASNRSRGRNNSIALHQVEEKHVAADPELRLEPSPDSSAEDLTFFQQEVMQPRSTQQTAKPPTPHAQRNGFAAFGNTSFVKSSIDMFANSDDEKENEGDAMASGSAEQDEFGYSSAPFFGSDPFDPFFDGAPENSDQAKKRGGFGGEAEQQSKTHLGQIAGFLATSDEDNIMLAPSSWEESHRFDAQFQDNVEDQNESEAHSETESSTIDEALVDVADDSMPELQDLVVDESVPQPLAADKAVPQSRIFDSQHEDNEAAVTDVPQSQSFDSNYFDEAVTATLDSLDVSAEEVSRQMQDSSIEDDEYTEDDEVIFDDKFGTFRSRYLDISFGAPCDLHRIPDPTQNPLTDNLIVCRCQNGDFVVEEVDVEQMRSPTTLISTHVFSNELEAKITRSFGTNGQVKIMGVSSVLSLAAGVHRVHGHSRVRVAALLDVVISSAISGMKKIRLVALWKWGYNPGGRALVSLQSVLSTGGIDDPTILYDPKTLQVTDGLLFLGGHKISQGGVTEPTVFIAKPAVRDSWAPVYIGDMSAKEQSNRKGLTVSALAAISDSNTFLAVGLSDGSVSVWTYDVAVRTNRISGQNTGKDNGAQTTSLPALLQLVCRMQGESCVANLSDYDCLWKNDESAQNVQSQSQNDGDCACLSWIQPCSSGISSLPLLAATFKSGVAVYHIQSESKGRQQTNAISITPLAKAKYSTSTVSTQQSKVAWYDLGPRSPPCISIFVTERGVSKLNICAIDTPWYGSTETTKSKSTRSIGVLFQADIDSSGTRILALPQIGAIACYHAGQMLTYQPTLSLHMDNDGISLPDVVDGYISSLRRPVSSNSLGLDTDGSVYCHGNQTSVKSSYQETVLTVFSTITCCKLPRNDESTTENWTVPSQRNWLLISAPGDTPVGSLLLQDEPDDNFDISYRREAERGGAVSDVLCELTCGENPVSGLVPERIVREDGGRRVAVLFSSSYFGSNMSTDTSRRRRRTHTRVLPEPVAYALFDVDETMKNRASTSFTLRHARDVAFLPTFQMDGGFYCSSIVVLDHDGMGLSITTVISSRSQKDGVAEKVIESEDKCLLHHEGIEGRRVFSLLNGDHPQLLLAGDSTVVGRPCLIVSQHQLERDSYSNTFGLIESDLLGHRLWLNSGEKVMSACELPKHPKAVRALVAVATQQRVLILSVKDSLSIVAQVDAYLSSPSLSPIGSYCVAFNTSTTPHCGGESRIMYLSCLQNAQGHGIISTCPPRRGRQAQVILTAIRPDRLVYHSTHGCARLIEDDESENKFDIPIPITRPNLLLEPLLANALCQDMNGGENASKNDLAQESIRLVIEKFGRKDTAFPYGDDEGIGSFGAGVTSKAYQMLIQHDCHPAASLLKTKSLPYWIPTSFAGLGIPSKTSSSSIKHAETLAYAAADSESVDEVIRLLDFARSQSSEDILRQVLLSLNAQSHSGVQGLFEMCEAGKNDTNGILSALTSKLASGSEDRDTRENVSQLAPVVQHSLSEQKRPCTSKDILDTVMPSTNLKQDSVSIKEGRHFWSNGPFGRKEKLLGLEAFEDWFGRCLPTVLGKEGVAIAAGTGEQTLANILSAAAALETTELEAIPPVQDEDVKMSRDNNWTEGIGEAHLDEDNLSLYIRFSEGADEDSKWKLDGFSDLTKHEHKVSLYGSEFTTLEATTSSADEGEEGKVQLLYDLVFNEGAPRDAPTGVLVQVARGGSLDVGMLHTAKHMSRQKCTIEFWYHLPQAHLLNDEIILARRSLFYKDSGDAAHLCLPDDKHNTLWELALLPTGLLELRTGAGSVVTSAMAVELDEENASNGIVTWEREDGGGGWNHVCLLFSSQSKSSPTEFSASILMNGVKVVSSAPMFVNPLEAEVPRQSINESDLEDAMESSILAFGIGPSVGFRITDIRVWACRREEEDVRLMMYEHLRDAEMKKKLKINIRKGLKKPTGLLAPPIPISQADNRRIEPSKEAASATNLDSEFLPDFANFDGRATYADKENEDSNAFNHVAPSMEREEDRSTRTKMIDPPADPSLVVTLSDLLSTKVRKSAASAIVRGPPAARHFGGNRGGLFCQDIGNRVGPIAICGSDKSIVFYHDGVAKTYPIGASGAVLSDVMDESQSEYMCCFLAKEKRMVVFELALKAVVVELQMKTKLNFWRYLPPGADGSVLTFMLITPIGGFHWKPLDDSPRPRQVWTRGLELESKKILSYEEGGCHGRGESVRSTVALVLASQVTSGAAVEAHCILMGNEASRLCLSPHVLGAALYRPMSAVQNFLPYVIYITEVEAAQVCLTIQELHGDTDAALSLGDIKGSTHIDVNGVQYDAPPLSMGTSPEALCCCQDGFIVAVMRTNGLVIAYDFTNEKLSLVDSITLGCYVVDAAMQPGSNGNEVEVVLLLCEADDAKDGRVATITISRD